MMSKGVLQLSRRLKYTGNSIQIGSILYKGEGITATRYLT